VLRRAVSAPNIPDGSERPSSGPSAYGATTSVRFYERLPSTAKGTAIRPVITRAGDDRNPALPDDRFQQEAKRTPVARRLATAPGIGPIRAALLVAIVVTPARFRTTRQFWSYSGLAIVTRSSSDWTRDKTGWARKPTTQTRGLNRNRHSELKSIFKGAASTVIRQMPNHPLHQDFQRMTNAGIKPNLAKLTLARRIAATTLSMWKHQQDYDPSRVKAPAAPQSP
jgi:hypothetical protein